MGFKELLSSGKFLVTAEFAPPKGVGLDLLREAARKLRGRLDAIELTDQGEAVMRACPMATAVAIQADSPPPILHLNCRDWNRLALQGRLLGASMLGIDTIIVEPGQDPAFGDHPDARVVRDLDPVGLIRAAGVLASGRDLAGLDLDGAPDLAVGAWVDAWGEGDAFEADIEEAGRMVEAGASFLRTGSVYDLKAFAPRAERFSALGVPLMAGLGILKSAGMARYINRNVSGGKIPEEIVRRMQRAPDKKAESAAVAAEIIKGLKGLCAGACIIPYGWEAMIPAVLEAVEV